MIWIILIVIILFIVFIKLYNDLVGLRQKVKNAWSQIEVQLQRRFDLIPNLLDIVKGYMAYESEVLTKITELRTAWSKAESVKEKSALDTELSSTLKTILAVSENYPDLKANQNFAQLQEELQNTENKVAFSRQFYNDVTTAYNTRLEVFPSNIIASMFKFTPVEFFEVESDEIRKNVKVDFEK